MKNSEIIEKLKILGIYSSRQLIEKDTNYWWQLQYQVSKNDQENLYLLNEALTDLNEIENQELISILNSNNSFDNQSEENSLPNNRFDNKEEDELSLKNNKEISYEHFEKAVISVEEEDFDNAVKEASLAINFDETNEELYATRCLARLRSSTIYKNHLMLDDINKAIDIDPTNAFFYYTKAMLLFEIVYNELDYILSEITTEGIEKLKEAKRNIDMAFKLSEEADLDDYQLRGRIKLLLGDIEGGRQDIIESINMSQTDQESIAQSISYLLTEAATISFNKYFGEEYMEIIQKQYTSDIQKRNLLTIEKDLTLAIKLDKNMIDAYFLRGKVKKLLNQNQASSRDFKIVGVKDPEDNLGYAEEIEEIENSRNFFYRLNQWLMEDW